MSQQKETVYIDIDDEITGIIDKVISAKGKVVALVLPKRATVMQSIVNMRLLKRSTEEAGKSVVLITSEAGVLPLASTVGVYVAKTLQSKPAIPDGVDDLVADEKPEIETEEPKLDETKPVGELAGASDEDAIEVDNDDPEVEAGDAAVNDKSKKEKKNKKLKIPNFDSFRKKLLLSAGLLILLIVGWYWAFFVAPTAKITLATNTSTTAIDLTVVVDPDVEELDEATKTVPALLQESKKTDTQKVPTTGEKNLGDKASGTMTVTNCIDDGESHVVPAGTSFSSGEFTFVTTETVELEASVYSGNNCRTDLGESLGFSKDVDVVASQGGGSYNLSSRSYSSSIGGISGFGSNMSGGTDKIVKIVSQADIDSAKSKAAQQSSDAIRTEVYADLEKQGYIAINETFTSGQPVVTASPAVGAEANEVTVTIITGYSILGAQKESVKKLIEAEAKKQVDTTKQSITDDGLSTAVMQMFERTPEGKVRLNIKTNVVTGVQLNAADIKKQVAGKRRGEIQQMLNIPGVTDVEVSYNPFWVTKTTKNHNKITIIFEKNENQ